MLWYEIWYNTTQCIITGYEDIKHGEFTQEEDKFQKKKMTAEKLQLSWTLKVNEI